MSEIQAAWMVLRHIALQRLMTDRAGDERGWTAQAVILTALFAAAAITIAGIIIAKFTDKARAIPTG